MVLSEGKKGDVFTILRIDMESKTKTRLQDMGLTQGVKIKIMAYYANNAYVLNVRGSKIVVGKDIASSIYVEARDCKNCAKRRLGRVD